MKAWYLVTTKLKSEIRVKQNLDRKHGLETFFPTYPARKANSPIGLPLFARYVFVHFDVDEDLHKVQYSPGVSKVISFGPTFEPVPEEVILCLRDRCDPNDVILPPDLVQGQRVRVNKGIFEGCQGIIQEKRGNRRIQLLLEMAYGPAVKVELSSSEVDPIPYT